MLFWLKNFKPGIIIIDSRQKERNLVLAGEKAIKVYLGKEWKTFYTDSQEFKDLIKFYPQEEIYDKEAQLDYNNLKKYIGKDLYIF